MITLTILIVNFNDFKRQVNKYQIYFISQTTCPMSLQMSVALILKILIPDNAQNAHPNNLTHTIIMNCHSEAYSVKGILQWKAVEQLKGF